MTSSVSILNYLAPNLSIEVRCGIPNGISNTFLKDFIKMLLSVGFGTHKLNTPYRFLL